MSEKTSSAESSTASVAASWDEPTLLQAVPWCGTPAGEQP